MALSRTPGEISTMDLLPFIDLQAQRQRLGANMDNAIGAAVAGGQWILGPQVFALEEQLAAFAGVKHVVTCANGTDAIVLLLRAWGVTSSDAVFVPAFTFAATAEAVVLAGGTPVFVDVLEDTFNMDPVSLQAAIAMVKREGKLRPRVVIPVDLFGQPADYKAITSIAERESLMTLCDTAQGFGGVYGKARTGAIGDAAATSFFPAKPLGCYGDGGACLTNDSQIADLLRSIRVHGQGADRYQHVRIGMTSRLDTIQAAVLCEKLKIFPDEIEERDQIARRYTDGLSQRNTIQIPKVIDGARSVWAQYTIKVQHRDRLQEDLRKKGIPTAIYYPIPLNRQIPYRSFPSAPTPVSESLSSNVLSLPMHPYLEPVIQDRIISAVLQSLSGQG